MTAFVLFQIRRRDAGHGPLALTWVCDNFYHAEPMLSLARPHVNRWPAGLDAGSLEHELEFNSVQRNSRAQSGPGMPETCQPRLGPRPDWAESPTRQTAVQGRRIAFGSLSMKQGVS
jgi:hypothetical protein